MKVNKWTVGLASAGVISLASVLHAEEAQQHPVMTALSSTTISGYVSTSAIWLFGKDVPDPALYGRSFDGSSKQNGFNLDVVDLTLERPLTEGNWSAGYKVSLWMGPDANTLATTSSGVTTSDFALRDAYVSLRAPIGNGLDFKFGVWDTLVGYETADSPNDPNFSRSFAFYMEPIVHTGVLATYQVNNVLSFSGGVAERGDGISTINSRTGMRGVLSYLGGVALTAPDSMGFLKGATLYGGVVDGGRTGLSTAAAGGSTSPSDTVNYYVGATVPTPLTSLTMGACYDYRANGVFDKSYENAVGLYASYQFTPKLKFNARGEYATGSNGSPIAAGAWGVPYNPTTGNVRLLGVTGTLDYSLWANAITRLECRWDHSLTGEPLFVDGTYRNAISLAVNVIYKF